MAGSLFTYAIVYNAKPAAAGATQEASVIVQAPKTVLAASEAAARMLAAREIPDAYADKLDQIEIVLRFF